MMRLASRQALVTRRLSVFTARSYSSNTDPPSIPSRWLFDLQHRIRQLLSGRTETEPVRRLREKLQLLDTDWLDLVAGRDGYIPDIKWRGLDEYAVAWGDMDSMGHINNCIYNKYAETARVNWFMKFATAAAPQEKGQWLDLMTPKHIGLILKTIQTDYKMPITYPDHVTVMHKFASAPQHDMYDFTLKALIFSHKYKRVAATFTETITWYNYRLKKKCLLDKHMIDMFGQTYAAQEHHRAKVTRLLEEVNNLIGEVEGSNDTQAQ